jgi:hypothetical protein
MNIKCSTTEGVKGVLAKVLSLVSEIGVYLVVRGQKSSRIIPSFDPDLVIEPINSLFGIVACGLPAVRLPAPTRPGGLNQ